MFQETAVARIHYGKLCTLVILAACVTNCVAAGSG